MEVEDGERWRFTVDHAREPVEPYLRRQGRFRHLSEEQVAHIQAEIDLRAGRRCSGASPRRRQRVRSHKAWQSRRLSVQLEKTVRMQRSVSLLPRLVAASLGVALIVGLGSCGDGASSLRGDWDYYRMLGAQPSGGFDALRRFGFAHFEKADTTGAWINRRNGTRMEPIHDIVVTGDSLIIDLGPGTSIRARISRDTIAGQYYRGKDPTQRVWFVRRHSPPEYEPFYRALARARCLTRAAP